MNNKVVFFISFMIMVAMVGLSGAGVVDDHGKIVAEKKGVG